MIGYDLQQFEQDVAAMQPRPFDTYVLPAFLMLFAVRAKGTNKIARRILFTSGVYMLYRNYFEYKRLMIAFVNKVKEQSNGETQA